MLNPSTPLGYAELRLRSWIHRARRSTTRPGDLGASVIEWVIISAIVVAIALTVGGLLAGIIETKASSINVDTSKF